jgi:hypothetical protein
MQRLNWKRMAVAVGAVCVVGGVANGDALAAMVEQHNAPRFELQPGEIQLNLDYIGANAVLRFPTEYGSAESILYQQCDASAPRGQRVCTAPILKQRSKVIGLTMRTNAGVAQSGFDSLTTDTVDVRQAFVLDRARGTAGDSVATMFRSSRHYAGVSNNAANRVLDGVDSSYKAFGFAKTGRHITHEHIIAYSNVTVPASTRGEAAFPTNGVIYSYGSSQLSGDTIAKRFWFNVIVHFDGTSTPEAYIDGKLYTLDLTSGIATPKARG